MENKFREFWIELEEKGARAFVYTEPVDGLNADAIHAVEYAALESANDKIAELKEDIREDRVKPDDYLYLATVNKRLESENKKLTEQVAEWKLLSEKLSEENGELRYKRVGIDYFLAESDKLRAIITTFESENTRLRAALEHIASPKHWAIDTFVPEIRDRVKIARDALKKWGEV